jgi:hypothetical protein
MDPREFDIIFYRKCLSQHNWAWRESTDPFDRHRSQTSESFLFSVASSRGREFLQALEHSRKTFPSRTANTKPKHNTPMIQLTINIPEADKLADAINNLAETLKGSMLALPVSPATRDGETTTNAVTVDPEPAPAKKRGRPAKVAEQEAAAPAPEPAKTVEPEAAEPAAPSSTAAEPAPAETIPTGEELSRKSTEYFKGDDPLRAEMRSRLVQFRNNDLGWNQPIKLLEDPAMRYQFNEKLEELKAELDQKEKESAEEV